MQVKGETCSGKAVNSSHLHLQSRAEEEFFRRSTWAAHAASGSQVFLPVKETQQSSLRDTQLKVLSAGEAPSGPQARKAETSGGASANRLNTGSQAADIAFNCLLKLAVGSRPMTAPWGAGVRLTHL